MTSTWSDVTRNGVTKFNRYIKESHNITSNVRDKVGQLKENSGIYPVGLMAVELNNQFSFHERR